MGVKDAVKGDGVDSVPLVCASCTLRLHEDFFIPIGAETDGASDGVRARGSGIVVGLPVFSGGTRERGAGDRSLPGRAALGAGTLREHGGGVSA